MRFILLFPIFLCHNLLPLSAQKSKVYAGPMVGAITKNSAKVWLAYKTNGRQYLVLTDTIEQRVLFPKKLSTITSKKGIKSTVVDFENLVPDRSYLVYATVEDGKSKVSTSFRTLQDSTQKDFSFLSGSCALMQPGFFRMLFPGASASIFKKMEQQQADFMLWLGDNLYYLGKDHKSYEHMFNRNIQVRSKFKFLKHFLSATPQYAIWDDHDYGPNDSGEEWKLKDTALLVFKHFWPNDYPDQGAFNGNYFSFRQYDAEFFMLDDRYFRQKPCDSCQFLGETQLVWLKNKLLQSDATFKFLAVGTQLLNTNGFGESYDTYRNEQQDLLNFITQNNIQGVLFLTGDKHYSEICKKVVNHYPIFDITLSPITTPPLPRKMLGAYKNVYRIPGSDYAHKNFGKISISGDTANRTCTIEVYSRRGKLKRSTSIKAAELSQQNH